MSSCPFCAPAVDSRIVLADEHCFTIWTNQNPLGSAMVIPRAHRTDVFELSPGEWASTQHLLAQMRQIVAAEHSPDGWNVGWNVSPVGGQEVMHAHCHLVPRYHDEPYAGKGIRAWLKDPSNRPRRHQTAE